MIKENEGDSMARKRIYKILSSDEDKKISMQLFIIKKHVK